MTPPGTDALRAAESRIESEHRALEEQYTKFKLTLESDKDDRVKLDSVLEIYKNTMRLMRLIEREIGIDELAGNSMNERWRRFRASTALSALQYAAQHIPIIQGFAETYGSPDACRPNDGAFSEMQRLVTEVYPDKSEHLRAEFIEASLPYLGFDDPIAAPRVSPNRAKLVIGKDSLSYENGSSEDIKGYLTSNVVKTAGVLSAPATQSHSADILDKMTPPSRQFSFVDRMKGELAVSPVKIGVALLIAALVSLQFWPSACSSEKATEGEEGAVDVSEE